MAARLLNEIREGCRMNTTGNQPGSRRSREESSMSPSHRGVAAALELISDLAERKTVGFDSISIDRRVEYRDGIRLGQFASPDEGFAEIARKRSFARPSPPPRC